MVVTITGVIIMRFYNRTKELSLLTEMHKRATSESKMTIVVGRRRVGKTRLLLQSVQAESFLYFFVSRKSEALLCEEFVAELKAKLGIPVFGVITRFREVFGLLMEAAKSRDFVLIIDEFQEFVHVNPAVYSEMQDIWDRNKDDTHMHLILCGSVYALMKKIFENAKEPLFGRADRRIYVQPFSPATLIGLLQDHEAFSTHNFLTVYVLTGGVARYVELLGNENAFDLEKALEVILDENSLFLDEGKNLLVEEFGKDYSVYFSILSLIASSKTSRGQIESFLERNIAGYLDRLEHDYNMIKRVRPIFAKEGSKNQKYLIEDNFLNFWFRFIYKYRSAIEIGNFEYVKTIIRRDFSTFAGPFLEKLFRYLLAETGDYSEIGSYWERGNKNEVDIVAVNTLEKKLLLAEVKFSKKRLSHRQLPLKARKLLQKLKGYEIEYKGFALEDLQEYMNIEV